MSGETSSNPFEEWLATRPPAIQELARKYPPGTAFDIHGKVMWVISYGEYKDGEVGLQLTEFYPGDDYDKAVETREPICPCCTDKLEQLVIKE